LPTTERYDEIKEQIAELIRQLPGHESGQQRALMMALDLQHRLQDAIKSDAKGKQAMITKITSDIKALDLLIDLNKKIAEMYSSLTDKGKEEVNLMGQGIRNHISRKNARGKGNNDSGLHEGAGS
jgi:hypothetical protein